METLYTSRLILKKGNLDDYKKVFEYDFKKLMNVDNVFEYVKKDDDISVKQLEIMVNRPEEKDYYEYIIYLKDTNEPIGHIIADRKNKEYNALELGYDLHPDYWNNGYMTEATVKFINFLFSRGYDNVLSGYAKGNFKSKGLLEKLGFKEFEEGIMYVSPTKTVPQYHCILSKDIFMKTIIM